MSPVCDQNKHWGGEKANRGIGGLDMCPYLPSENMEEKREQTETGSQEEADSGDRPRETHSDRV